MEHLLEILQQSAGIRFIAKRAGRTKTATSFRPLPHLRGSIAMADSIPDGVIAGLWIPPRPLYFSRACNVEIELNEQLLGHLEILLENEPTYDTFYSLVGMIRNILINSRQLSAIPLGDLPLRRIADNATIHSLLAHTSCRYWPIPQLHTCPYPFCDFRSEDGDDFIAHLPSHGLTYTDRALYSHPAAATSCLLGLRLQATCATDYLCPLLD
jgi:hypothetical protein